MEQEIPGACPLDCPDGCSWIVTVRDGEAVRLRGNPDHPFTRGALCAKVARYLDHTRTPDRLLHPLRRVGAKGEGRFERISWDDALGEIAERLLAVRERARRRGDLAVPGHRHARLPAGPGGPRGRAAVERARRERAR